MVRVEPHRFHTLSSKPATLEALVRYGASQVIDLDKAWSGLLWLISEECRERPYMMSNPSLPETWAIVPVEVLGRNGLGYSEPEDVTQIHDALSALDR